MPGSLIVLSLQPTLNQAALAIEKCVAKMQTTQLQLLDQLTNEFLHAGAPPSALVKLNQNRRSVLARDPTWFNSPCACGEAPTCDARPLTSE